MVARWLPAALALNTCTQGTPEVKVPSWSLMLWVGSSGYHRTYQSDQARITDHLIYQWEDRASDRKA